ncbi:ABC transporter substrate-binding protein, partial [Rugamonas sp. FT82W]|nr:ABC transporter substrate-binding protein [Duganella vulcania]
MSHRRPRSGRTLFWRRLPRSLAAVALVLACGAQAAEKVSIQLKWMHQFQFAGYYAAQDQGYYRDVGLDVTLIEARPGVDPTLSVLEGRAQYGVGNTSLLVARGRGQPVVALASIFQHSASALLVRHDAGGKARPWAGSRVMLAPNNEELLILLKKYGVRPDSLTQVPHSYNTDDLLEGRVDAMSVYLTEAPYQLERSNVGYELLSARMLGDDFYGDTLYTTESELREHPMRAQALREATLRGWRYAMAHPGEIADLIRARYPERHSREHLMYEAQHIAPLLEQGLIGLGYSNPERWQAIARIYIEQGMLPADFKLDGFLYQPQAGDRLLRYAGPLAAALLLLLTAAALWRL